MKLVAFFSRGMTHLLYVAEVWPNRIPEESSLWLLQRIHENVELR
jgi:hypothetical protein